MQTIKNAEKLGSYISKNKSKILRRTFYMKGSHILIRTCTMKMKQYRKDGEVKERLAVKDLVSDKVISTSDLRSYLQDLHHSYRHLKDKQHLLYSIEYIFHRYRQIINEKIEDRLIEELDMELDVQQLIDRLGNMKAKVQNQMKQPSKVEKMSKGKTIIDGKVLEPNEIMNLQFENTCRIQSMQGKGKKKLVGRYLYSKHPSKLSESEKYIASVKESDKPIEEPKSYYTVNNKFGNVFVMNKNFHEFGKGLVEKKICIVTFKLGKESKTMQVSDVDKANKLFTKYSRPSNSAQDRKTIFELVEYLSV